MPYSSKSYGAARAYAAVLWRAALLSCGIAATGLTTAMAAYGQTPTALVDFVQQLDAAASQEDLTQVMQAYSRDLVHSDGLTDADIETALEQFWEQYSNLTYKTDLTSWEETSGGYSTETETTITGTRELGDQMLQLTAVLTSQQE
ncbi:MAG: hypothetical protein WBA10_08460, partial [Elainellaceae cyanobacterium]